MKRFPYPLLLSILLSLALAASLAYWGMQLYQPPQRQRAVVPMVAVQEPMPDAGMGLFGGQATAMVSSYQLTGVVAAGRNSVAIIVTEGQPPQALKVGRELAPGILVSEVHPRYVMLSEGGVPKRLELAPDPKAGMGLSPPPGVGVDPSQMQQGGPTPHPSMAGTPGPMVTMPPPTPTPPTPPVPQPVPQPLPQQMPPEEPIVQPGPAGSAPPQMPSPTRYSSPPVQ